MKKQLPWFELILAVVFMSAQLYAAFSDPYNLPNKWFIRDDAYYYFKVAQNISEGHGSTFDGIHPTNGYHPLWLLINIPIFALARFDLVLPLRILLIVTSLLQVGTSIFLFRLLKGVISTPAAMLAAIYWTFDTNWVGPLYKTGMESGIALFLIMLLLFLLSVFEKNWRETKSSLRQIALLGIVAILVTFGRLDLVFFSLIVGIWVIFRATPIRYLLPLDILAIVASVLTAFILRLGIPGYYDSVNAAIIMIFVGLIIKTVTFYFMGLYQHPSNWNLWTVSRNTFLATVTSSLLMALLLIAGNLLKILPSYSRIILLADAPVTFGFIFIIRLGAYVFRRSRSSMQETSPINLLKLHWTDWLKDGSIYYGIVGGALAIYMIWNKLAFGTSSPVSGQIKRWWATFATSIYGGTPKTLLSFLMIDPNANLNAWNPFSIFLKDLMGMISFIKDPVGSPSWDQEFLIIILAVFVITCGVLYIQKRKMTRAIIQAGVIPLFAGCWLQISSYSITGYASPQDWYWLTEQILLVIMAAFIINIAIELLLTRWMITRIIMWTLIAAIGIYTSYNFWAVNYVLMPYGQISANTPYLDVLPYLEGLSKPGDIIGMTGGGNIGYFIHDRTVVNMDGLINSNEYFQALKNGTGSDYLYNSGMRYVFANPGLLESYPYRGQYTNRLKVIDNTWGGKFMMQFLPKPDN